MSADAPDAVRLEKPLDVEQPQGNMIIDIGGGTSETAVISLGGIVALEAVRVGSFDIDNAIQNYIRREHGIAASAPRAPKPQTKPKKRGSRQAMIAQAFINGRSIAELEEQYQVKKATLVHHLEGWVNDDNALPLDGLQAELDPSVDAAEVEKAFSRHGTAYLRPVYDQLGGTVSFDELKLHRLVYRLNNNPS